MVFPAAYRYKMDDLSRKTMKGRREPGRHRAASFPIGVVKTGD